MNKNLFWTILTIAILFCICSCSSVSVMSYEQRLLNSSNKTHFCVHLVSEHKNLKVGNPIMGYTYISKGDWYFNTKDSIIVIKNSRMAGIYNVTKF